MAMKTDVNDPLSEAMKIVNCNIHGPEKKLMGLS